MFLVAAALSASALLVWWTIPFLYPFLLGWLLAYALNPLVRFFQDKARFPRWLAVGSALLLFTAASLALISFLVMRLVDELMSLSGSLQELIAWGESSFRALIAKPEIQSMIGDINDFYRANPDYKETIHSGLSNTAQAITHAGTELVGLLLGGIVRVLYSLPAVATIAVVVLLASFFIGKDWEKYTRKIKLSLPRGLVRRTGTVWTDLRHALFGYLRAQLIMISITAGFVILGLWILGVRHALSIGLLIGFVDLLPYLGVGAAMIPWIAYAFLSGDWHLGTGLSILYAIVLIARQFIEPKVLASSVGLEPLSTLVAMFVGLQLFGIAGLIVGPILMVVLAACRRAHVFRDIGRYVKYGRKRA